MSSLTSFNSSESMSFLALSAVFLLVSPVLFMGFTTMWANIKQKVSDELYARAIEIVEYLDTPEIEKTFTEFDDKLTAKVDTRISNFKSTFIAEINEIYAEINRKFTEKDEKNKARDDDFTNESQSMISTVTERLDRIEEACHNDFGNISSEFTSIKASIEILQNDLAQRYAVVRRADFDQQSMSN